MTIAVLPFNAGPNTKPSLARQLANFAADIVRNHTGENVNAVNYLIRLDESQNPRLAHVNPSETINEYQLIEQLFEGTDAEAAMDGLLVGSAESSFELDLRTFKKGQEEPMTNEHHSFLKSGIFSTMRLIIDDLVALTGKELPDELSEDENLFGTSNADAFLNFLDGYDALQYIDKTQGMVAQEFDPSPSMESLLASIAADEDWEAPYITLVQLCRACTNFRIGNAENVEKTLKQLMDKFPQDGRAVFALGELYEAIGNLPAAADTFEKASMLEPNEPAILTRIGMAQMAMNMPVNAERNFRKAVELEGDDKPSMDYLASVLQQTNRAHEVPALWKGLVDSNPQNSQAIAKLAIAYAQNGQFDEAEQAFEGGLKTLEDATIVKRYYAPFLAQQKKDFDRAMDLYEDCLDVAPTDIPLMVEYAQTLQAAGRDFEIPKVLRNILGANPDPNTRAQTLAWLIELEQPKRVEIVQQAQEKIEAEDYAGAIRDLQPLRNWLADYWKMWALYAAALNRSEKWQEAEEAATALINLFPGCEPAYAEIATALGGQGKHEEAYNAMRFGASQVQNSLPIALNLALAAKRTNKADEARHLARQIREALGENVGDLKELLDDLER